MKVPFTAQSHQSKPVHCNNNTVRNTAASFHQQGSNNNNNNVGGLCYEPKSLLELRRSSSPAVYKPVSTAGFPAAVTAADTVLPPSSDLYPLQLEDYVLNQIEDWDSLMRELGFHEDSSIQTSKQQNQQQQLNQFDSQLSALPEFPPPSFDPTQFLPSDFTLPDTSPYPFLNIKTSTNYLEPSNDHFNKGSDSVDDLIRVAECFETNSVQLAQAILARLNQHLPSPTGKPLQRASFYFKEALQSLVTGSARPTRPSNTSEVINTIKAYKAFSNVSPIPLFTSFTANQAILEAVDGSMLVHIIDFDIGLGGQWASFMKELSESRKPNLPVLRITAVVPEEYAVESRLISENLIQFASELKVGFDIEFVSLRTFEYLSFKAIKFVDGVKTVVLLSPSVFRRIGSGFLNDIRWIPPHVAVHVDSLGLEQTTFRQCLIDGLEFYSTVLESLEAAKGGANGGDDWIRRIETFVLYPKILEAVEAARHRWTPWRDAFMGAGMRTVVLSHFAEFQAECLLRSVQVKGFHVAKHHSELVLCWHGRPLVATSAWRY